MTDDRGTIQVNGSECTLSSRVLSELLTELGYRLEQRGFAAAVNGAVVPRSRWEDHELQAGDEVEIVGAVQGG